MPVTAGLLQTYETWLDLERSWVRWEHYGWDKRNGPAHTPLEVVWRDRTTGRTFDQCYLDNPGGDFDHTGTAQRAAIVLSAVGCPLIGEA